jgi:hypothetical protein
MGVDIRSDGIKESFETGSENPADVHLSREIVSPPLTEVSEFIKRQPESLEYGLVPVDSDLIIPSVGEIDVIAVSNGTLILVSTFQKLTCDHIGKATHIKQWVADNAHILRHVYAAHGLQRYFPVRILFLCSELDPQARTLMTLLDNQNLEIFRYRCLASSQTRWIVVEKVEIERKEDSSTRTVVIAPRPRTIPKVRVDTELTEEEINDFFDGEMTPEDNEPDFDA